MNLNARALLLPLTLHSCVSVVVQRVSVTQPTVEGQVARLQCLWSEGSGPPLYSLRWCKDGHQFFIMTLRPVARKVVIPLPGVKVLTSASDEHGISLSNVSSLTAGTYTCEAMSDLPDFLSSALSLNLTVTVLPTAGPRWRGVGSVYPPGQPLKAHCVVLRSRPPATFSFIVNNIMIHEDHEWIIKNTPTEKTEESVWNSSATLSIPLSDANIKTLLPDSDIYINSIHGEEIGPVKYQTAGHSHLSRSPAANLSVSGVNKNKFRRTQTPLSSSSLAAARRRGPSRFSSLTRRLNLTCVAKVSSLSYETSTWTVVSFPTRRRPNAVSKLEGNTGWQPLSSFRLVKVVVILLWLWDLVISLRVQ